MPFNRGIFVRSLLFVGKTIRSVASKVWYSGLTRRILQRVSVFFGIRDKNVYQYSLVLEIKTSQLVLEIKTSQNELKDHTRRLYGTMGFRRKKKYLYSN